MSYQPNELKEFDAVILAGDRDSYKPVLGENKAFLEIEGMPLIYYVIDALQKCRYVSRIFVVGPEKRLSGMLEKGGRWEHWHKEIIIVPQMRTAFENTVKAFMATLPSETPDGEPMSEEIAERDFNDKAVLYLGADLPLLTAFELDEFIEGCDLGNYDYLVGMTAEQALSPYCPRDGKPGIRLVPFCFRDSKERQNNLHLVRLFRIGNRHYPQLMYENRYQRNWKNIFRLLKLLYNLTEVKAGVVFRFLMLHICRLMNNRLLAPIHLLLRQFVPKKVLEADIGRLLKTRFSSVVTTYGGAALDIDNENDFMAIRHQFNSWRDYLKELNQKKLMGETTRDSMDHTGHVENSSPQP